TDLDVALRGDDPKGPGHGVHPSRRDPRRHRGCRARHDLPRVHTGTPRFTRLHRATVDSGPTRRTRRPSARDLWHRGPAVAVAVGGELSRRSERPGRTAAGRRAHPDARRTADHDQADSGLRPISPLATGLGALATVPTPRVEKATGRCPPLEAQRRSRLAPCPGTRAVAATTGEA